MSNRTKTYIAADWTGDENAVEQMYKWNDSKYWGLSFVDAHDLTQARDDSLYCSIKTSLKKRLDVSKMFVLIVGNETKTLRKGSCQYCSDYNSGTKRCDRGYSVDYRSYIEYECEKALDAYYDGEMSIVILYNAAAVDRTKCPDVIKNIGTHAKMQKIVDGKREWDYQSVKEAMGQ